MNNPIVTKNDVAVVTSGYSVIDRFQVNLANVWDRDNSNGWFDGLTINESNTVYIQDILVQAPNYISGCRDEAMNPFSATEVNYISASRDVVRELGTMKNINYVSASRIIII